MSLVRNERTKLTASWLNAISAASIAVGGFAQLAPLFSGSSAPSWLVAVLGFGWILLGFVLHWLARHVLGGLEE
jgi:VIT1/CCC1 family predicted Fe2+/Mn2+ transporter